MHRYRVVGLDADDGLCVVQSSLNRFHRARPLGSSPGPNMVLLGDKPHLGFGILVCEASGAIFRVIFESINNPGPAPRLNGASGEPPTQWRVAHALFGAAD